MIIFLYIKIKCVCMCVRLLQYMRLCVVHPIELKLCTVVGTCVKVSDKESSTYNKCMCVCGWVWGGVCSKNENIDPWKKFMIITFSSAFSLPQSIINSKLLPVIHTLFDLFALSFLGGPKKKIVRVSNCHIYLNILQHYLFQSCTQGRI